ncbi:hypothetical protein GJAV_G00122470 [Gymnothorax javanicus]|nr:hypothetical protein GJAV_G00122470 [Gymnothorax javanicus]
MIKGEHCATHRRPPRVPRLANIQSEPKGVLCSTVTAGKAAGCGGNDSKMATLKEDQCYGLSCGRVGGGTNISVFHVKLTDSALRAFEGYQSNKSRLAHPTIQFSRAQGKIYVPRSDGSKEGHVFTFDLSNVGRDNPQGSFDCIQQYITSTGRVELRRIGGIRDKLAVCATDESYQKARQSMALAEEENRSRGAIVIKHGGRYVGKRVQVHKPIIGLTDVAPSRRTPRPVLIAGGGAGGGVRRGGPQQRPLRERLSHLLALKPYQKAELLLRLMRDGLSDQDKESLDGLLQEVAVLSSRDSTFTLKDELFKDLQSDWPGYTERDQQLLNRILKRRLCQSQNRLPNSGDVPSSPLKESASRSPSQKQPAGDFINPLVSKKQRISHLASKAAHPVNGKLNSSNGKETVTMGRAELVVTSLRDSLSDPKLPLLAVSRSCDRLSNVCDDQNASKGPEVAGRLVPPPPFPGSLAPPLSAQSPAPPLLAPPPQSVCSSPHRKTKKSKKHKDKEKSREKGGANKSRGDQGGWEKHLGSADDLNGVCKTGGIPMSASEAEDYRVKYSVIGSPEQRQVYKNDFIVEYNEYKDLHARIEGITGQFTVLDSQLKQLQRGTDKYKMIHDQILEVYHKIKKTYPNYSQERNRCEYLHNKLAYIKRLVSEYDQQQLKSRC